MRDMDMKETLDILKKYTGIPSPSGNEMGLAREVYKQMKTLCKEVEVDNLGNVMGCITGRKPGAKRVLLSAHMDEVSFMVHKIQPDGFIKITRNGGIPEKNLLGLIVELMTDQGSLLGLIGTRSHHLTGVDQKYVVVPMEDLYIDAGFTSAEEAAGAGVRVGTPVVYKRTFFINGSRIFSNALDDRIGLTSMIQAGKLMAEMDIPAEIWIAGSVQEEWSLRGILPIVRYLQPDAHLCCDMYPATDTPDLLGKADLALGKGPVVSEYNFHGRGTLMGLIPDPVLRDSAIEAAAHLGFPIQRGVLIGVLTDASYVQTEGRGVATLDIAIPARYSHSGIESSDVNDLAQYIQLIAKTVEVWIQKPVQNRKDLIMQ